VRILRSVTAILAGFAVFATLVGIFTPLVARTLGVEHFQSFSVGLLTATLGYSVTAAVIAGYLTAWIAGHRELPHAAGVGLLIIAMSFVSMRQLGETRPGWYETTIASCGPIAALFGAALRRLTKPAQSPDS
jgi:hypothetical protein